MSATTSGEFRISPSRLGALCAPDYCPLCYWRLLRLKFRKPYQYPMPAVMFRLDAQEKRVADASIETNGILPSFFGPFCDAKEVMDIRTVSGYHAETNLKLFGLPDLVFRDAAKKLSVIDNKTAAVKPPDHPLSSMYTAQTNFYGYLLENCEDAHEISRVGILYYECAELSDGDLLKHLGKDFMTARFIPTLVEVEYDPEKYVVPLLRKVRDLLDMDTPPAGNDDCKDCALLDSFHEVTNLSDAIRPPIPNDQRDWQRYSRECYLKQFGIKDERQQELDSLWSKANPDGVLAYWFSETDI